MATSLPSHPGSSFRAVSGCPRYPPGRNQQYLAAVPTQLAHQEQMAVETSMRAGGTPADAATQINKARLPKGIDAVSLSTVYRFLRGSTHQRGAPERRGRRHALAQKDIASLDRARKRLLKRADGKRLVTYDAIQEEAGLLGRCCSRTAQDALRKLGVRFRAPRRKVLLTAEDAKHRLKVARSWVKRPSSFWAKQVHAYVDNKAFPLPLTPAQKSRLQKTAVVGHLRKASEGLNPACTKPREKHSFLGIPSVTISAAVAKDRVIMWDVVKKSWSGAAAAVMYAGPLASALKKTWGKKRQYTIVEDGDRKGNQSGKGVAAKERAKIRAVTLPPRTPAWMPLDYAIWYAIDQRMAESAPDATESKADYLTRLENTARSLPRSYIRKVLGRMKGNIQAVIDAGEGYHAKND